MNQIGTLYKEDGKFVICNSIVEIECTKYYNAILIPEICKDLMFNKQVDAKLSKLAEIIYSGLMLVGIIPLIDEATSHQEHRTINELNKIFNHSLGSKLKK